MPLSKIICVKKAVAVLYSIDIKLIRMFLMIILRIFYPHIHNDGNLHCTYIYPTFCVKYLEQICVQKCV